jgi:ubiquinone/menaquinone biosynthesis C-methylase UbiE
MGIYSGYIFPRVLDLAMRVTEVERFRERLVPAAQGTVLEIGIGSGLNVAFYGPRVERLVGIDPSPALLDMARRRAAGAPYAVELLAASAERVPLEDGSVDTAVTTFSLCTIGKPLAALAEVKRVLKPGGTLLFAEHGLAPDAAIARWQRRLNPVWRPLAGGCNLDRPIAELIAQAGFRMDRLDREYARGPRVLAYVYSGAARRA